LEAHVHLVGQESTTPVEAVPVKVVVPVEVAVPVKVAVPVVGKLLEVGPVLGKLLVVAGQVLKDNLPLSMHPYHPHYLFPQADRPYSVHCSAKGRKPFAHLRLDSLSPQT
jgi:hypothetical protein